MCKLLTLLVTLALSVPILAHPESKVRLNLQDSVELIGNIRAFVADVSNDLYIDGDSENWNGIEVMISLPKKYEGKWITILYKNKPTIKGGERLELGDYLQFNTNFTESLYINNLRSLRKISEDKWIQLYSQKSANKEQQ